MSKVVFLLSCDGLNVDVIKSIKVENNKVEEGVLELFKEVESEENNILDWELEKELIEFNWIEREFECCNEWNSIIVVDESINFEEEFKLCNYNLVV